MFAVAALFALAAIFWPRIRVFIPEGADDVLAFLATSRVAWLAMFLMAVMGIVAANKIYGDPFDPDQKLEQIHDGL